MHIGRFCRTDYYNYDRRLISGKTKLESVQKERELGVLIRSDLKSVSQCNKSAATARRVIGMVRPNFRHLDIDDFQIIYKTSPLSPRLCWSMIGW